MKELKSKLKHYEEHCTCDAAPPAGVAGQRVGNLETPQKVEMVLKNGRWFGARQPSPQPSLFHPPSDAGRQQPTPPKASLSEAGKNLFGDMPL